MKQKRSIGKAMLSFCLAIMLILQTVALSPAAYADSSPGDSGTEAVSKSDTPNADEPSVTEAVYDVPNNFVVMTAAPTDKTAVFMGANTSFPLEVKQGNAVIDPNGTIQGRQQFTLKSEGLKVPVNGDDANPTNADPENYIQKGDWIELKRDDYFKEVVLPTATKTLNAQTESGMKQLGTVYFTPTSIRIVFNGDDNFFNGVGRGIVFSFETTADADLTGMEYGDTKSINIFGTAYQLNNPDVTAAYSITLSSPGMIKWDQYSYRGIQPAQFVEGAITWESTVSAFDQFDNKIKLSLDGKTFFTDPASYNINFGNVRGIYAEDSFKVNGNNVTPNIGADGSLTYTFPPGTGVDPKVEYKTWIPKEGYYYEYKSPPGNLGRSYRDMLGKVELKQGNDKLVEAGQEISFAPDWIQATASYDHPNETITWTVVVNQYNKQGLKNFTITNVLPAGLEFTSATWQTWVNGVASKVEPIIPDKDSVYSFGNIDGKVQLIIKSKVKSGSNFRIDPRANWDLDTPGGIQNNDVITGTRPNAVTDEAIVTIGAHSFTKTGSTSMEDYNLGGITWTVNLTPQYALPNAAVYDVLVHGGDLNVLDKAVDETGEVNKETIAKIKANVNDAQTWKKYHVGTLKGVTNATGLTLKAIPLTVNGEVVADLIKVTGYTTDQATSFSFRALETNPDFLFKQNIEVGKGRWNRALLFEGETVKQAQISINLHLRMLNKDMLFASKPLKADGTAENVTPNNVSSYIRDDNNEAWTISAYDRTTKTVTFRLGVNMPGYNTEEMAKDGGKRVISNIKLVDTLPEGWEFVPFSEGKDFELWKGFSDNGAGTEYGIRNDAKTLIEPGTNAHVVSFSHNGNVGTFTFSKLESPYVILVKARPSNAALEKYLEAYTTNGTDKQVLYNKADLHMTWGGVEKTVTEQRKVIVPIQTLSKSVSKPTPGVLEWTVNYTPPFNMEQGVFLQDTIGANMNLRYDVDGKLVLTAPSMAVYRAKLTASGALEREGAALDLNDPNAEVQVEAKPDANSKTILTFKMDDPNQLYQFVYQTEVDNTKAKAGDKMGNEVKLVGDDKLKSVSAKSESTLDSSDVAGSSSSNALLPLKKVDPNGNPLKDVEFTLYKKDDGTQVAKGKTGIDGKLNLLFPDPGYYELKETYIDTNTWLPTTRIYQVYVGNTPGKPIWVDGVKVDTNNPLVVPTPAQGKLTISNIVEGNGSDKAKEFVYTVTFDGEGKGETYPIIKPNGSNDTIKSGDSIIIKDGQKAVLPALPADLIYTVTQTDYTADGYTTDPGNKLYSSAVENKGDHKAAFINKRVVNKLTISNTVMGNGGEKTKDFEYIVTFDGVGKGGSYPYTMSDGSTGTIKSGDDFRLKDGQSLEITGLPENLKYTVTQKDYTADDYTTIPSELHLTGTMAGVDQFVPFTNVRVLSGSLLIGNTVKGNGGDMAKEFQYTISFTGDGADGSYSYTKPDGSKGTISHGDTFVLKHGEVLLIEGLPVDLEYTVTENDYSSDGYTTDPGNRVHSGKIAGKIIAEARFVNTRQLPELKGVLRDNTTGKIIPNAEIIVTNKKTEEQQTIRTDENGEYFAIVEADTDYTITFTKMVSVGGKEVPVMFTQKASIESGVTDETVPAEITAVGIVLFKQSNGQSAFLDPAFTTKARIYLKDAKGDYIEENGKPKAFPLEEDGTFAAEGLITGTYTMEVRYEVAPGKELTLIRDVELNVGADGELNISQELIDPYGIITDAKTGAVIEGAKVTLYYKDGTEVKLPPIPGFAPNDNASPSQNSDANGAYAFMVFPDTDYYLVVTKAGYETYKSPIISVGSDIVRYDVQLKPVSSGGGNGNGNNGNNGNNGTDNGNNGT
ncbi:MAG TPA: SpaA isopeptide-forming pilin-related protein, partial [Paenibacillus sp.]